MTAPTSRPTRLMRLPSFVLLVLSAAVLLGALDAFLPYVWAFTIVVCVTSLGPMAYGFTSALAARARLRPLLRQPIAYDEDGRFHVGVILPGETFRAASKACVEGHTHVIAQVVRADGTVRQEAEWTR